MEEGFDERLGAGEEERETVFLVEMMVFFATRSEIGNEVGGLDDDK